MASNLLVDLTIRAQKPKLKAYTLRDGNGLFLLVHPNGSKYFQLRTTLHGKSKLVRLGVYPNLSLSEARIKTIEAIKLVEADIDPTLEKKIAKAKEKEGAEATFKSVAMTWLEVKQKSLAKSTHLKIQQSFNANVYARIGNYPIGKIDNIMVRDLLIVMQKRDALELMEKTLGWIKQVFDFALADLVILKNPIPPIDLRLDKHVGEKFPSLKTVIDAGKLLRNLVEYQGTFEVQICVTLMVHLAQRPSELRESTWEEFDLQKGIWTLPIERDKVRQRLAKRNRDVKPHTIMLSRQALGLLNELKQYTGTGKYLFSARITGKPVSEATIRKAFRTCFPDYKIVPHGCRHFFSTHANAAAKSNRMLNFDKDVIESSLGHVGENNVQGIYDDRQYEASRRQLAQWWSDQLDMMRGGAKVLPFEGKSA
jgi:integrase